MQVLAHTLGARITEMFNIKKMYPTTLKRVLNVPCDYGLRNALRNACFLREEYVGELGNLERRME